MAFEYPVIVQFEDVDRYDYAHHTKLIAYLERARVHYLLKSGFDMDRRDVHIVLYELSMTFRKPARLLDELTVSVSQKSLETYRVCLAYRILRGSELIARATSYLAFVSSTAGKPVPVPEELKR
jgi:acyl-CoA thioester hydrolase